MRRKLDRTEEGLSAGLVVKLALALGLLTGLCEAGLLWGKQRLLGQFVRFGPDVIWMAPVADALLFLGIGLALVGAARWWKRTGQPEVVMSTLAFAGFLSVLLMYYPLHAYARLLLAAGLAATTTRLAKRRPGFFDTRLVSRSVLALVAIVGLLALGASVGPRLEHQGDLGALKPAPADAPNVLLIVWDTVRARNLSLHGYPRPTTPALERWAKSAAVFERATATSPWTLPSHASMFTGEWPRDMSAGFESALDGRQRTLAEALASNGYVTAGFVANTFYCGYELGLARGFSRYDDYPVSLRELAVSSSLVRTVANNPLARRVVGYHDNIPRRQAAAITDSFLAWHATLSGRPFFAFLNYFDAHEPYLPPPPFDEVFGAGPEDRPQFSYELRRSYRRDWSERPAEAIAGEINRYDGAIAYLDSQLDRLLTELQARGTLDDTIVIITSDHGEQFGEHGLFVHGNSLYQPLLDVPLVIRFPPLLPSGRRIESRVSLRDLPATVIDLSGLSRRESFPGKSLARYWAVDAGGALVAPGAALAEVRDATWAEQLFPWYPASRGDMTSVTDDLYHYIRNGDGREELYSAADFDEIGDLVGSKSSGPILERYRAIAGVPRNSSGQPVPLAGGWLP